MKRVNSFPFYELGTKLQLIKNLMHETKLREGIWPIIEAQPLLEQFLGDAIIPLGVSKSSVRELLDSMYAVGQPGKRMPRDLDREIGYDLYFIHEKIGAFEHVLAADLQQLDTYFVPKKSIYSTNDLINFADNLFSNEVKRRLNDQVRRDICEAGKCIAFELATAAGFHIARSVEGVLLDYLNEIAPAAVSGLKPSERNLGHYINLLEDNGGEPKICAALDQFRDLHRNPLMHPEANLSIDDALALLGIAQSAIVVIAMELEKLKPTVSAGVLAMKS